MRYGMLVFIVCMICAPFTLAESGSTDPVPRESSLSLPDASVHVFSATKTAFPSQAITSIVYFNRTSLGKIIRGTIPVSPGNTSTIVIRSTDILVFKITGKYTGPAGTYAMMDWYNYFDQYPMNGTKRVDAAIIIPTGSSGTLNPPPYWYNYRVGNNSFTLEMWGNKTAVMQFFTVWVKT